jgi:hypothetical protein
VVEHLKRTTRRPTPQVALRGLRGGRLRLPTES